MWSPDLASIGTVGDSYDNAMAESVIGLYKAECVRHEGPVRTVDDLELRTLTWVHWFNHARLHSSLGHVPPVEFEQAHHRQNTPVQHRCRDNSPSTEPGAVQTTLGPPSPDGRINTSRRPAAAPTLSTQGLKERD